MRRTVLALLLAGAAALPAAGCTEVRNPATGEVQYTSLTPEDEKKLGDQEAPKAEAEFGGPYDNAKVQAYVTRVGNRVKDASELGGQEFAFTVLDTDVVNAFALPGGHVFVTRGLLALANDEAELAGVLGHEIGHVTARHTAQRYDRAQLGQLGAAVAQIGGLLLGGYLGGEQGARLGAQAGGQAGGLAAGAYVQGYSREQEFQADQLGIRYLAEAGYDPDAMASFLQALQAEEAFRAKASGKPASADPVGGWLASHPRTPDRVARAAAEESRAAPGARETDPASYLAAIDGMVYGDNPDQGVVEGARFAHPGLRFAFEAPRGFKLQNTATAVIGADGRGRVMQLTMGSGGGGGDLETYLQGSWVRNQRLQDLQSLTVNGLDAAVGFGQVAINQQPASAMFSAVRGADGKVYRLLYAKAGDMTRADVGLFEASLRSFRPLSAAEAAAYRPKRIDVVTVGAGDTAESLGRRMAVEPDPVGAFALLNGLDRGRSLRPGEKVKLVVEG